MTAALAARAATLLREGRDHAAIDAYRTILRQTPSDADAWYNLAYLERRVGSYQNALLSFRRAVETGISRPEEAHVSSATILSEHLSRTDLAIAELRTALHRNPCFFPALFNLAILYEDLGDFDAARGLYDRALSASPGNAKAIARIAMLDISGGSTSQAIRTLSTWLVGRRWLAEDEAELRYALARGYDDNGAYAQAWENLQVANRLSRHVSASQGFTYNRKAHEAFIDALIKTFPVTDAAAPRAGDDVPLFICGLFRSGSTLVEQILASHSRVTAGGELEFLPRLILEDLQPYPGSLNTVDGSTLAALRMKYLKNCSNLISSGRLLTDKRPDNFLHIGLIRTLFPDAKIVHTCRSKLDNILSLYFLNFQDSVSYGFDLEDAAHWIAQYERLMAHWKDAYTGSILDIDYDRLVAAPEPSIRRLLSCSGLAFEEQCLSPHRHRNAVRSASSVQVRQPIHSRASGRADRYRPFMAAALGEMAADV